MFLQRCFTEAVLCRGRCGLRLKLSPELGTISTTTEIGVDDFTYVVASIAYIDEIGARAWARSRSCSTLTLLKFRDEETFRHAVEFSSVEVIGFTDIFVLIFKGSAMTDFRALGRRP